jgi:hypothetical protein
VDCEHALAHSRILKPTETLRPLGHIEPLALTRPFTSGNDQLVDELLTTTQAARALGVSPRSLSRWAKEGRITPAMNTAGGDQRSGRYLWDLEDLRAQLLRLRTRGGNVDR